MVAAYSGKDFGDLSAFVFRALDADVAGLGRAGRAGISVHGCLLVGYLDSLERYLIGFLKDIFLSPPVSW